MKPKQQRIAIAEACGWTDFRLTGWGNAGRAIPDDCPTMLDRHGVRRVTPDYINDLNAMHEAEKSLPDLGLYFEHLDAICREQSRMSHSCRGVWSVSATAAQRAEAFLKTLNLWTE